MATVSAERTDISMWAAQSLTIYNIGKLNRVQQISRHNKTKFKVSILWRIPSLIWLKFRRIKLSTSHSCSKFHRNMQKSPSTIIFTKFWATIGTGIRTWMPFTTLSKAINSKVVTIWDRSTKYTATSPSPSLGFSSIEYLSLGRSTTLHQVKTLSIQSMEPPKAWKLMVRAPRRTSHTHNRSAKISLSRRILKTACAWTNHWYSCHCSEWESKNKRLVKSSTTRKSTRVQLSMSEMPNTKLLPTSPRRVEGWQTY